MKSIPKYRQVLKMLKQLLKCKFSINMLQKVKWRALPINESPFIKDIIHKNKKGNKVAPDQSKD